MLAAGTNSTVVFYFMMGWRLEGFILFSECHCQFIAVSKQIDHILIIRSEYYPLQAELNMQQASACTSYTKHQTKVRRTEVKFSLFKKVRLFSSLLKLPLLISNAQSSSWPGKLF